MAAAGRACYNSNQMLNKCSLSNLTPNFRRMNHSTTWHPDLAQANRLAMCRQTRLSSKPSTLCLLKIFSCSYNSWFNRYLPQPALQSFASSSLDTVGWAVGRTSGLQINFECRYAGGDDLTGALHAF